MAQLLAAAGVFRDRDFFIHDGSKLRRFRITASVQLVFCAFLFAMIGWAGFATARLVASPDAPIATANSDGYSAEVAKLAAETERRVQQVEQRPIALAAALAGVEVDEASLR